VRTGATRYHGGDVVKRSRHSVGRAFLFAGLALAGCEKPVPETPTFAKDVGPIFAAHCVRCHGAGGTLNSDPRAADTGTPGAYLDQYADKGDCTLDAMGIVPPTCIPAARFEAETGQLEVYLHGPEQVRMPPPPGAPLSPWELAVVDNWLAETPPMP
jgi:hypothetical protein